MRFGPAKDAPNPIQRLLLRSPLAAALFGAAGMACLLFTLAAANGRSALDSLVPAGVTFALGFAFLFAAGTWRIWRHGRSALGEEIVPYLPWPRRDVE